MLEFEIKKQVFMDDNGFKQLLNEKQEILEQVIHGNPKYSENLGWFYVKQQTSAELVKRILDVATEVKEKADVFVLIGVGGSNNAARAVIDALKDELDGVEILYFGNTLSPRHIKKTLRSLEGKSVYINCIAKNFETLEPGVGFRVLRDYLYKRYGAQAYERIIVTGSKGSSLEHLSQENGYRFFEFPKDVGGRYTALTAVGLLPMAVAGVDIHALIRGAEEMEARLHEDLTVENPAYQYAVFRQFNLRHARQIELLAYFEPQFRYFTKWWIQLFAESEGKENKGIYPTSAEYSEDLHAVGQYIQEGPAIMFETFLDVKCPNESLLVLPTTIADGFDYLNRKDFWDINKTVVKATVGAHGEKLPLSTLRVERLDAESFGELFYFFSFACYLSCELLGVNPFNQPGVEQYKQRMFDLLKT